MKPLPDAAMPIVLLLRELVPRPEMPLVAWKRNNHLRFSDRWKKDFCPMGFLPNAIHPSPVTWEVAGEYDGTRDAVAPFYKWWDRLTADDAKEAMDLIWPQKNVGAPC